MKLSLTILVSAISLHKAHGYSLAQHGQLKHKHDWGDLEEDVETQEDQPNDTMSNDDLLKSFESFKQESSAAS